MDRRLTRNYKCTKQVLNPNNLSERLTRCSRYFVHIQITKQIGQGQYGKVYKAIGITYNYQFMPFVVKVIENINQDETLKETEFAYHMSYVGIGPEMYDAFFYKNNDQTLTQILFMEPFIDNCHKGLSRTFQHGDIKTTVSIIKQTMSLLYQQIFTHRLLCVDIKLENFLYKSYGGRIEVRMIDFDENFCSQINPDFSMLGKRVVFFILLIQLYAQTVLTLLGPMQHLETENDEIKALMAFNAILKNTFFKSYIFKPPIDKKLNTLVDYLNLESPLSHKLKEMLIHYSFGPETKVPQEITVQDLKDIIFILPNNKHHSVYKQTIRNFNRIRIRFQNKKREREESSTRRPLKRR